MTRWILMLAATAALALAACSDDATGKTKFDFATPDTGVVGDGAADSAPVVDTAPADTAPADTASTDAKPPVDAKPATDAKK
jgi:hypothetical protein